MFGLSKREKIIKAVEVLEERKRRDLKKYTKSQFNTWLVRYLDSQRLALLKFVSGYRTVLTPRSFYYNILNAERLFVVMCAGYSYNKKMFLDNPNKQLRAFFREREEVCRDFIKRYFAPKATQGKFDKLLEYKGAFSAEAIAYAQGLLSSQ